MTRNEMIKAIKQQLNGDTDVLAPEWYNLPTEDIQELYDAVVK